MSVRNWHIALRILAMHEVQKNTPLLHFLQYFADFYEENMLRLFPRDGKIQCLSRYFLHSEKFKMNEEVDSFLSEKVSNLLLT